jgi:hypothetical protein
LATAEPPKVDRSIAPKKVKDEIELTDQGCSVPGPTPRREEERGSPNPPPLQRSAGVPIRVHISYLSRAVPAVLLAVASVLCFKQLDPAQLSRAVDQWHSEPIVSVLIFLGMVVVSALLTVISHELLHYLGFRAAGVPATQLSFSRVAVIFPATILEPGHSARTLRIGLACPAILSLLMFPMLYTSWGALWLAPLTTATVGLAGDFAMLWEMRKVPGHFQVVVPETPDSCGLHFEAGHPLDQPAL